MKSSFIFCSSLSFSWIAFSLIIYAHPPYKMAMQRNWKITISTNHLIFWHKPQSFFLSLWVFKPFSNPSLVEEFFQSSSSMVEYSSTWEELTSQKWTECLVFKNSFLFLDVWELQWNFIEIKGDFEKFIAAEWLLHCTWCHLPVRNSLRAVVHLILR